MKKSKITKIIIALLILMSPFLICNMHAFLTFTTEKLENMFSVIDRLYVMESEDGSDLPALNNTIGVQKTQIEEVYTVTSNEVPENAFYSWDVSERQNGSIMAYVVDEDNDGKYELYIGQNGGVRANPNTNWLFKDFDNTTKVDISNLLTNNTNYFDEMFSGCTSLEEIIGIEDVDASKAITLNRTFQNCSTLTSLDLTEWEITDKLTTLSGTFSGCTSLTSLDVSNWDTSNVTDMLITFQNCSSLTSLDVTNWDTSNVEVFNATFRGMTALTTIDLSKWDTSSATTMWGMFLGDSSLEEIPGVDSFDMSNVTTVDYMFQNCSKLKNLDLSKCNVTDKLTTMVGTFDGCTSLESVDISTWDTSNVTTMSTLFRYCKSLTGLDINSWDVEKVKDFTAMFQEASSLTSLDLSSWKTSSATTMWGMFLGCSSLEELKVDNFDTSKVTDMTFMFQSLTSLTSLDLSSFVLDSAESIGAMFQFNSNLTYLDITGMDFSGIEFDENDEGYNRCMFDGMPKDAKVYVKSLDVDTWFFDNLIREHDYPENWVTNVNVIPPETNVLAYDVQKINIISDDLLTFTDKSTTSESEVYINDSNRKIYAKVKLQGTSSLSYDKKNYTITFYDDYLYENKTGIIVDEDWGAQSKYCLKANYIDSTQSRNIVSARLAASMQEMYGLFTDTPNNGLVDGFFVEVYVNNEYLGLYTMNIPKDAWMFNMDEDNENHIVMCAENANRGSSTTFEALSSTVDGEDWSIEVGPNDTTEETEATFAKLNRVIAFVKDSTDEEFRENLSQYINLDALMNYYCFMALSNAVDNMSKNMLLVTYDGEVWYPSLYDLDTTWGLYFDGSGIYSATNKVTDYGGGSSLLFEKLVRNFPEELQQRYNELRSTVLSNENITNEFEAFYNTATAEQWEKEQAKWSDIPSKDYGIDQILEHLEQRGNYIDSKMNQLYHATQTYDDSRIIYKLSTTFVGGINKFIDTGINLYEADEEDRQYTILLRVKSDSSEGTSSVLFSSRNLSYYGMYTKNSGEGTDSYHTFNMGQNAYEALYKTNSEEYTPIVITLNGNVYNMYSCSVDQKRTITSSVSDTDIYNVVIGADYYLNDTTEVLSSFFTGEISDFIIYNEVLSEDEISTLLTEYK